MRRVASLGWATVFLFGLLFPSFARGQYLPVPGPGPIAPASDSPAYSGPSSETFDPPPPRGYAEDIRKAKQEAASRIGVAPGAVQHDSAASPEPGWAQPLDQFRAVQESEPTARAPALITSFNGISYTGSIPPDPVIAAGPTNLVLSTNGSVTIREKAGTLVASTSLVAFFSAVRVAGENAFDPRVVFDPGSSRFFLSATGRINNPSCTPATCVSHLFLAVSKTSSPATTASDDWHFYAFDATLDGATPTTNWADFPGLGVDGSVVVLTANMFSFSTDTFQRAKIRILDKSALITGGALVWTDFVGMTDPGTGFLSFTLQPALTFGSPGTFFLVSASSTLHSCDIVVWGIANSLSSPTLSALKATAGGTCDVPPNAPQLGGGTLLDTGDERLLNAVYRSNSLWTAQTIQMNFGSGNVSAIRWVQINAGAWPSSVSLIQDSTFGADGIWYFYPTVMVDASNNLAIILARSSASEFGSASYTGRLGTDPPNTLQPSALLKAGAANYLNLDGDGNNRWGDYLGIGLDPSDGSFWVLGEYAVTSSQWGTWVGRLGLSSTVTAVSLTPDKPSPQPLGTTILWTAGVTGGTAPQFQFWVKPPDGGYTVVQAYSSSNTYAWTPTVAGGYLIGAWARSGGSAAPYEAFTWVAYTVTPSGGTPVTAVSLTPNLPSPRPVNTPIVWTAVATGGTAPQFRFWVQPPGGAFAVLQDYGPSAAFPWTPTVAGTHVVAVWARSAGSGAAFEAFTVEAFNVTAAPVTAVSLTPNKPSPQPVGTTVVFTAVATGGTAPQFQFWVQPVGGPFTILCAYSSSNTCPWTPNVVGDYFVFVWARSTGSSVVFEADRVISFTAISGSVTAVSLTPDKPSPQPVGTTIVFTAVATGGTAPQFQFWVRPVGGAFQLAQPYSPSNTFAWTPSVAGDYFILVWARSGGASVAFEADREISFTATPTPVTAVSLTPDKPSPQPAGTGIVFTAVATGGTAPQFQFWVQRVVEPSTFTSPFTLLCDYSSSTTCPWTHKLAGDFNILVWARSTGSSKAFEEQQVIVFRLEHL